MNSINILCIQLFKNEFISLDEHPIQNHIFCYKILKILSLFRYEQILRNTLNYPIITHKKIHPFNYEFGGFDTLVSR